jgi:hypothetical protein
MRGGEIGIRRGGRDCGWIVTSVAVGVCAVAGLTETVCVVAGLTATMWIVTSLALAIVE